MTRKEFNWAVGRILKKFRKNARVSQIELSQETGIPQPAISEMERGNREIKLWEYYKICDALNIDYQLLTENLLGMCRR